MKQEISYLSGLVPTTRKAMVLLYVVALVPVHEQDHCAINIGNISLNNEWIPTPLRANNTLFSTNFVLD